MVKSCQRQELHMLCKFVNFKKASHHEHYLY